MPKKPKTTLETGEKDLVLFPSTHGGRRPGAGRRPLSKSVRRHSLTVTITPDHREWLELFKDRHGFKSLSEAVERLIDDATDADSED